MDINEVITTLEAMKENAQFCFQYAKEDRKSSLANRYAGEVSGIQSAIWLLTEPAYLANMKDLFCPESAN